MGTKRDRHALRRCITAHVNKNVGPIAHLFHWRGAELVHVNVLHVPPTRGRNRHTLLTCGMSQRPMCPPEEASDCRFAELYLSLPPDWPIQPPIPDERSVWPIRELAQLARFAHTAETWLWYGHTVGAEDPKERITPGAGFTAWILGPHLSLGHDGCVFEFGGRTIYYHSVLPIYPEELDLARTCGPDVLFWLFSATQIDDLVNIRRPNVAV
jgi:hypothetical protein